MVTIEWLDETNYVFHVQMSGDWTWKEFYDNYAALEKALFNATTPATILFDSTLETSAPAHCKSHMVAITRMMPRRVSSVVFITSSTQCKDVPRLMRRIRPNDHIAFHHANTIRDALRFI